MSINFEPFLNSLLNQGVVGVVLAWFMFRNEELMKKNTDAINDLRIVIEKMCNERGESNVKKSELS